METAAANLATTVESEPWIALAGLLKLGRERGDLTVDEAQAGLREARAGTFQRLSERIAAELQQYLHSHAVA